MPILKEIRIKETLSELRSYQKRYSSRYKPLQMLILIKEQGSVSKYTLAKLLGASPGSITTWRTAYIEKGIESIIAENRGGYKSARISVAAEKELSRRLHSPKEGFRSFIEIQQWLLTEFQIDMHYHAVNKYVRRKYGGRLKVSRKSHVQKSPADEAVFKKPV